MTLAGPSIFSVSAPNGHVWAQQTRNNVCRRHRLGPELFRRVPPMLLYGLSRLGIMSTDDISWAQSFFRWVPPMLLYGPSRLGIISTGDIGWAQNCFGGCP